MKSERRKDATAAVVLLSGGLDSATAAAWAQDQGYRLSALSIDYGQRHRCELDSARAVAASLGITDHITMAVDLAAFGGSALVDPSVAVPKGRSNDEIGHGIPVTYVPARNTVFLALSLAMAETRGAEALVIGVNAIDYSGYPDCRPEFIAAFATLAKPEIIRLGLALGLDYGLTTSCYDPDTAGRPCGACDSCHLRAAGFAAAGAVDPRAAAT